jgi:hypothetical protein
MVFWTGIALGAETGGMASVVEAVRTKRPVLVMTAVSASRRSVFIMRKNVRREGKLRREIEQVRKRGCPRSWNFDSGGKPLFLTCSI